MSLIIPQSGNKKFRKTSNRRLSMRKRVVGDKDEYEEWKERFGVDTFGEPRVLSGEDLKEQEIEPRVGERFETDRIDFGWEKYELLEELPGGDWAYKLVRE